MPKRNRKLQKNVVRRYSGNPIISLTDIPFRCSDVHNAGAVKFGGQYILLVTVESLQGDCALYRAVSDDGKRFTVEREPILAPAEEGPYAKYEHDGVRDARVTLLEGTYYVTYLAQSRYGFRVGLGRTEDFRSIERMGLISEPDTKNGVLFPRKFNGRYARLERPREGANMWVSYSHDLMHWGDWEPVMTRRGGYWDSDRIGASTPPMEVECGWLVIYYGEKHTASGPLFRLGAVFLDHEDPATVVGRSNIPILSPREDYERIGDVENLVFCCGALRGEDGGTLEVYYGAANSCICLGTVDMEDLQRMCMKRKAREG